MSRRSLQNLVSGPVQLGVTVLLVATGPALAQETTYDLRGRVSPQVVAVSYPDDSAFRDIFGSSAVDSAVDSRLVFGLDRGRWSFDTDYQLVGVYAERIEFTRELPDELKLLFPHLPDDNTRLWDLTHVITDSGKTAVYHRLDRLSLGFATEHVVMKLGRQAISWGNGLVFNVMDIFNPFDPAAVDKEFKTGDDMLYAQYLHSRGHDLQAVVVGRRDPLTGEVESDQSSFALKYHHMGLSTEIDLLGAEHYGDPLAGIGVSRSVGGAVLRGDVTVTFTDDDTVASGVASYSKSWVWGGKNTSGLIEYFYNGFGRSDGCYSPECLAESPELLERVGRGELFNLGRHYLAASALIEITPLFQLTPNVFMNLTDPSALAQVVFQNDLRENLLLWSAINIPIGSNGTEYGGAETAIPGVYLSSGPGVSVQLVWYW